MKEGFGGLVVLAVLSCIFIIVFSLAFLKSIRTSTWINAKAKISMCGVDVSNEHNSNAKHYSPWIEYEYHFNNNAIQSSKRVYLGRSSQFNEDDKEVHLNKYKVGTIIDVWVDPKNSEKSVIEFGVNKSLLFPVFLGVGFLAFSIFNLMK